LIYFLDLSGACFCGLACWNCGPKPFGFQVHCRTKKPTPSVPTNHQSRSQYGASLVSLSDHWITHPRHRWFTSVLPKSWNLYWNQRREMSSFRHLPIRSSNCNRDFQFMCHDQAQWAGHRNLNHRPTHQPTIVLANIDPIFCILNPHVALLRLPVIYVRQQQQSLLAGSSPES
jgi:hypothetical protein